MPVPTLTVAPAHKAARAVPALAVAILAACGASQDQGGFPGMPPAQVTTMIVSPKIIPVAYEYVGQTTGSKEVEVRARVTGILEQKLFQEGGREAGQRLL
jgi:membrane fusion protein (multidrug efflux system)